MAEPTQTAPLPSRELHLSECPAFARHLAQALEAAEVTRDQVAPTLDRGLVCECVQCGIRLGGEDLLALSLAEEADLGTHVKADRVRQGYCARNGCSSYFYRFTFRSQAGLDWAKVLGVAQTKAVEAQAAAAVEAQEEKAAARSARHAIGFRVLAGIGLVVALVLVRQWIVGGRIPFLREPEQFTVDPASLETEVRR
jgi:hypothetical protein